MIIEVKNSGVRARILENGKREDPSKLLHVKLNELEATTNVRNFELSFSLKPCFHLELLTKCDSKKKLLEKKTAKSLP
jgi:hypothetical protein